MDNENGVRSAHSRIERAVVLRLIGTAVLSVLWAMGYYSTYGNLLRIYYGNVRFTVVLLGFLADTVMTIMWLFDLKRVELHRILHLTLGAVFYLNYSLDVFNSELEFDGYGWTAVASIIIVLYGLILWLVGLIPINMCRKSRDELLYYERKKKEESEKEGQEGACDT